jgi:sarcosine oxidase subunit delta
LREFTYRGHATGLDRPAPDAGEAAWDNFVFLRDNPAGPTRDLWYHSGGCGAWLVVDRNTVTHEITSAALVEEAAR